MLTLQTSVNLLVPGQGRGTFVAALLENVVPMKNSTVILGSVNARSRTRKAPARQNQEIARANSGPFAAATEKRTGTHVRRRLQEYQSTMRVNARLSSKRAGESQVFDAPKAKPVWTILPMIATPSAAGLIVRGFAKVDSLCSMRNLVDGGLSVHQVFHPGCSGLMRQIRSLPQLVTPRPASEPLSPCRASMATSSFARCAIYRQARAGTFLRLHSGCALCVNSSSEKMDRD